jgi:hypothetical protein
VQQQSDHFLLMFSNERYVARVKKGGPWSFQCTMVVMKMVDQHGVWVGHARVHIVLSLHWSVCLEKKVRFFFTEEYELTFKYERFLGCCRQCARLDHVGVVCPEAASTTVPNAAGFSCSMENGSSAPPIIFQANLLRALSSSLLSN